MGIGVSPAAMAQAAEDVAAYRNMATPDLQNQMTPLQAEAMRSNPQARQITYANTHQTGPFGKPIPAEVLRRSDNLTAQITIPADGTAVPPVVQFWLNPAPDGIVQSTEVVNSRLTSQVNFETRSLGLQLPLGIGDENWDALQENANFEVNSVDQNIFRRTFSSGIVRDQASFATAVDGNAAPVEVTLITGKDPRGIDLDPVQYILWAADQTLTMVCRFTAGLILPVNLGQGATITIILNLWGRKQTLMKG